MKRCSTSWSDEKRTVRLQGNALFSHLCLSCKDLKVDLLYYFDRDKKIYTVIYVVGDGIH